MLSSSDILRAIAETGVVAIVRMNDPSRLSDVVRALYDGGIRALEVTMTVPGAVDHIARLAESAPPGFVLGAGTVLDADTVHRVVDAGARFIVSPVFRRSVVDASLQRGVLVAPGCFTPTEILDAWEAGAQVIKVFPATRLGPSFLKDVRAPLPFVKLIPTGGVTPENAGEWIAAGAEAVGVGTSLLDPAAIAEGRLDVISERARAMVESVRRARGDV
jgi:2-dehydro-3-deoxyphosphogluconate aldolase/(4S)-4-hydroxy-2-oxoglutarate aldolase